MDIKSQFIYYFAKNQSNIRRNKIVDGTMLAEDGIVSLEETVEIVLVYIFLTD
ncbi:hypothetical protein MTYM_00087 [Methylococcales bacterium]|nr:hypothetical protein MTYM_00087 [Methylococcales bacterium]